MKYHILLKFLAIVLCACSLAGCIGSALGILVLEEHGLYKDVTPDQLYSEQLGYKASTYANFLAIRYAGKNLGGCPDGLLEHYLNNNFSHATLAARESWYYTLSDDSGALLDSRYDAAVAKDATPFAFTFAPTYPTVIGYTQVPARAHSAAGATIPTVSEDYIPGTARPAPEDTDYLYVENYFFWDDQGIQHQYEMGMTREPVYTVHLYLPRDVQLGGDTWEWQLLDLGYELRYWLIGILLGCVLVFALGFTYLCCAAGRKPYSNVVQPGGLNRIPLDLYAFGGFWIVFFMLFLIVEGLTWYGSEIPWVAFLLAGVLGLLGCVVVVAFLFACAAQLKMPKWFFLRYSLTGRVVLFLWRSLKRIASLLYRKMLRLWSLLPVMWQWLLTGFGLLVVLFIGIAARGTMLLLALLVCLATVVYGAYCYGTLLKRTKDMSQGDLNAKVNDQYLVGSFREHAQNLNALADVVVDAAKKQMQSERMKAELVTNVSHDIKTPLTSIINYVDLLQKAENQAQAEEYVQVLDRQSQRLKKLIDDLMEMSKASTGNIAVDLTSVDPVEAITQALGEFSEKLEGANLIPIFTAPEAPVQMQADGRLLWRVLSNLLSNTVKYALPGTRVYIDLAAQDSNVLISLKNISREPLNVPAQELLERFVRGDASRNTEGSGLGLNIAKNLMELQGGSLQLLVDGDLFKVTLSFSRS